MADQSDAHEHLILDDQDLLKELHRLAPTSGKTPQQLLTEGVRRSLQSLRAAAIPEPTPGTIDASVGSEDRRTAEKLAVAASLLLRPPDRWEAPFMQPDELSATTMRLARIGAHLLADDEMRGFYQMTRQRDADWTSFPEELQELATVFVDSDAIAPLAMLKPSRMELCVTFNVHGRFGLAEDRDVDPFGGATSIRLLAGRSRIQDSEARELVGVEVTVPIDPQHPLRREGLLGDTFRGLYFNPHLALDQERGLRAPELEQASEILHHILSVLRLTGRRVAFEPYAGDLGPPWGMTLILHFEEGSVIKRTLENQYGLMVTAGVSHRALLDGLDLGADVFAESWAKARDICAVLAGADSVKLFEQLRRHALVIESRFNAPKPKKNGSSEGRMVRTLGMGVKEPAFAQFVQCIFQEPPDAERAQSLAPQLIEDLPHLRNEASHCARWDQDGRPLGAKGYGLRIHDAGHRERFAKMLPTTRRLALGVLAQLVPGFEQHTESDLKTLLDLWFARDFSEDPHLRRQQALQILRRARNEGERDPRLATFLVERIRIRDSSEAVALAELCPAIGGEALEALFESLFHEPVDNLSLSAMRSLLRAEVTREALEGRLGTFPKAVVELKTREQQRA